MPDNPEIKIGFCIAYDWEYLRTSLPLIYSGADRICLSLDRDRISWTRQTFPFDNEAFFEFVRQIDTDGKIVVYEDDFHLADLKPMENEVRQRNKMAEKLGTGGWHIQLDTDEFFVDFAGFVNYLRSFRSSRKVNICCPWYTMYKKVEGGYLFIKEAESPALEYIPVATRFPHYEFGRRNGYFNIKTTFAILHQSWARPEQEIFLKISNWGHKDDFDVAAYFERWKALDKTNFSRFKDFHPIIPSNWHELEFVAGEEIPVLISNLRRNHPFKTDERQLRRENSIWHSRLNNILRKLRH